MVQICIFPRREVGRDPQSHHMITAFEERSNFLFTTFLVLVKMNTLYLSENILGDGWICLEKKNTGRNCIASYQICFHRIHLSWFEQEKSAINREYLTNINSGVDIVLCFLMGKVADKALQSICMK